MSPEIFNACRVMQPAGNACAVDIGKSHYMNIIRTCSPPQTCGAVVGAAYAVFASMHDPQPRRLCHH